MQEQYGKKVFSPEVPLIFFFSFFHFVVVYDLVLIAVILSIQGNIQLQQKGKKNIISMAAKDLKTPAMSGYMLKIGATLMTKKVWRRRWCVLQDFVLYYYETPEVSFLPSLSPPRCHPVH